MRPKFGIEADPTEIREGSAGHNERSRDRIGYPPRLHRPGVVPELGTDA